MEMGCCGANAASCFVKSLWDAVGLNCTAVGKLVYRGTGTSYLVMRLVVDWVVTSGFLILGGGFSHGANLLAATVCFMKPSLGTLPYDAGQYGSSF